MRSLDLTQIQNALNIETNVGEIITRQKQAFMDFSTGLYTVPMPMQYHFPQHNSDCHIKGGHRQGSESLVVKIANAGPGGITGVILVFDTKTGKLTTLLHDEGLLTTLRTAVAGVIVSELIPWPIENIGIVGSGNLARMLHRLLKQRHPNKKIYVHARSQTKAQEISPNVCGTPEELTATCDVILTATASTQAIIKAFNPRENQAIIGLESDDTHKQEIAPELYGQADIVIVDSKAQAQKYGDVAKSLQAGIIKHEALQELGDVLTKGLTGNPKRIIADFSGIGPQDVALVEFVLTQIG